jgi:hypothetical protein
MGIFLRNRFRYLLVSLGLALVLAGILMLLASYAAAAPPKDLAVGNNIFVPNAVGNSTALTPIPAGRANWDCVDDYPSLDTSDYVYNTSGNSAKTDTYRLTAPLSGMGQGAITNVTVNAVLEGVTSSASANLVVRVGTTDYPAASVAPPTTSWAAYTASWANNPTAGNPAWTWSDIASLQAGVTLKQANCAQLYVQVAYRFTYKESAHTTPWGTSTSKYDQNNKVVYFYGAAFTSEAAYHLNFYDSQGALEGSFGLTATGGVLSLSYPLPGNLPPAKAGIWRVDVVQDSSSIVAQQDFEVDYSAIPEFPTVVAAILVPLGCVGVYFGLRRKTRPSRA